MSEYFTREDNTTLIYYQLPKVLVHSDEYKKMKDGSKFLYVICLDLVKLSMANNWFDEDGRAYIKLAVSSIKKLMDCSNDKAIGMKRDLESFGLLEEKKFGQGKANHMYLKKLKYTDADVAKVNDKLRAIVEDSENQNSENQNSKIPKNRKQEFRKSEPNKSNSIKNESKKEITTTTIQFENANLQSVYPNVPIHQISQELMNDNSLVKKTRMQYRALMELKIGDFLKKPSTITKKKTIRKEILPSWFEENPYPEQKPRKFTKDEIVYNKADIDRMLKEIDEPSPEEQKKKAIEEKLKAFRGAN